MLHLIALALSAAYLLLTGAFAWRFAARIKLAPAPFVLGRPAPNITFETIWVRLFAFCIAEAMLIAPILLIVYLLRA
jgi:hypothetical protein